jgi:hypothetical protein
MEFQGRIAKVLPVRSGVSQRTGNEWKALPFIFEYFENPTDRFADSVVLETFDTKVIENLKEGMEVRCGFGHKTREYEGKTYIAITAKALTQSQAVLDTEYLYHTYVVKPAKAEAKADAEDGKDESSEESTDESSETEDKEAA